MNCRISATMSQEIYDLIEDDFWPASKRALAGARPIVAHTSGRWATERSREREILSRLSLNAPVFVVEQPVFTDDIALGCLDVSMPMPDVWRAVPRLPAELSGNEEESLDRVRHFTQQMIGAGAPMAPRFDSPVVWYFTPMPAPRMLGALGEVGIVYDCVDERTWLRLMPFGAAERERLLLSRADVVFASEAAALRVRARAHSNVVIASPATQSTGGGGVNGESREARWTRMVSGMQRAAESAIAGRSQRSRLAIPVARRTPQDRPMSGERTSGPSQSPVPRPAG